MCKFSSSVFDKWLHDGAVVSAVIQQQEGSEYKPRFFVRSKHLCSFSPGVLVFSCKPETCRLIISSEFPVL